jgi:flagellar motility protein MotE (MotC chaperone)
MTPHPTSPRPRVRVALALLLVAIPLATGCSGLLQNLGAKWVTRQIAAEFDLDDAQSAATRASVDRLIAAAPGALSSKVDMLVATVDAAIATGLTEKKLVGMERQVDRIVDIVAGAIIDEAAPILATLRDDQIDFAEARINERLDEAREELAQPKEERLEKRQDAFVNAVEDWIGDTTEAQEASIRRFVAGLPDEAAPRLAADEHRLARIASVLRAHPGAEKIRDTLWNEWKDRENWGPDARSPAARRAEGRQALLFVYGMLDAEQKTHASEHLHALHAKVKAFLGMAGS